MIQTLIFDLDGTLVDSKKDIADSVNRTLISLDLPPKELETIYRLIGEGVYRLIAQAMEGHTEEVEAGVAIFKADYRRHLLDTTTCYGGVPELLDRLRGRFLAVVTNKSREFTIPILEGLGLLDRFDCIIAGDDEWPKKPAPDAMFEVMKRSSSKQEGTMTIGDNYTDILAGKNAGIATCWASYGFGRRQELIPDFTIREPLELLEIVQ
ncbi:MAG: HAD family hydrolase [bacterium]